MTITGPGPVIHAADEPPARRSMLGTVSMTTKRATKGPPAAGRPVVVRVTVRDRFVVTVTMRVERRSGATRTDHFRSAVW
jgi:hypothetical protein